MSTSVAAQPSDRIDRSIADLFATGALFARDVHNFAVVRGKLRPQRKSVAGMSGRGEFLSVINLRHERPRRVYWSSPASINAASHAVIAG